MKRIAFVSVTIIISGAVSLVLAETLLRSWGYGNPPLYEYNPAVGFLLKPNQQLERSGGTKIHINNLGMRSEDTSPEKPDGVYRVLVVGDSVPYGGSYIDQEETFSYVAERLLNQEGKRFQILNAGVNALGPQNIRRFLETRGTYSADLVIVYFPWGNLRRDFSNYYIVPFWSNAPGCAIAEFMRHAVWMYFGKLSQSWKEITNFDNEFVLTQNLEALKAVKDLCDRRRTPVFFFWSPDPNIIAGTVVDKLVYDKKRLWKALPEDVLIDLGPQFAKHTNVASLFVDACHYARSGHQFAGEILRDFIKTRKEQSDSGLGRASSRVE
ncbi:MAG: hypothetical protein HY912_10715 [Desulfomonile tiedjei]|uniref:SGNH/GDSL hydrolase family protein n=1 Tax=Desulfomonile tiedjei TaxID=2358 RepID=A0A9D6V376_9BACT|nr:hypothetical protein [Desulfomonile tiedjei]